jgi:hypothetical protein
MIKRASGGLSSFLKSRWRTSLKDQQPQKRENTPEDIERDWIKHQGLHFAFHG